MLHTVDQFSFSGITLSFGLYFALTWLIVLTLCMKPKRIDMGLPLGVAAFTAVVGVPLVVVATELPFLHTLNAQTINGSGQSHGLLTRRLGFVLGAAVVEEVVKALPVYLFVYHKGRDYRPLTFAYVGVVSGLAFGVVEAVE